MSYLLKSVRTAAILTDSYVAGTTLFNDMTSYPHGLIRNNLTLLVKFTKGSLTSAEIKIEGSHDGVTFYNETSSSIDSTGATESITPLIKQITDAGNHLIYVPWKTPYIRISAKGTGTVTGSSLTIDAILSVA